MQSDQRRQRLAWITYWAIMSVIAVGMLVLITWSGSRVSAAARFRDTPVCRSAAPAADCRKFVVFRYVQETEPPDPDAVAVSMDDTHFTVLRLPALSAAVQSGFGDLDLVTQSISGEIWHSRIVAWGYGGGTLGYRTPAYPGAPDLAWQAAIALGGVLMAAGAAAMRPLLGRERGRALIVRLSVIAACAVLGTAGLLALRATSPAALWQLGAATIVIWASGVRLPRRSRPLGEPGWPSRSTS